MTLPNWRQIRLYILFMKAVVWRGLMAIGMKLHHFASPKPPTPAFTITIPSRLSRARGKFKLVFYVPDTYYTAPDDQTFPVVVNYHGGGFTLGTGTDDARWAQSVVQDAGAVMVSVEYRLAPKYPFSIGVEDGTDAILYLASHADELRIDPHKIALSGFSAGANFAFTVPLMLHDLREGLGRRSLQADDPTSSAPGIVRITAFDNSSAESAASTTSLPLKTLEPTALEVDQTLPDLTILCIVSFYPPTDFRITRAEKRVTNPKQEKNLPPMLTDLFDESYMPDDIDFTDPYLSPAAATDSHLRDALPEDIVLYTCEWDMLNAEGVAFGERLKEPGVGKIVKGGLIKEVPHAFDKKPNPVKFPVSAMRCYGEACAELTRVFGKTVHRKSLTQLDLSKDVDRFDQMEVGEGSEDVQRRRSEMLGGRQNLKPVAESVEKNGIRGRLEKGKERIREDVELLRDDQE